MSGQNDEVFSLLDLQHPDDRVVIFTVSNLDYTEDIKIQILAETENYFKVKDVLNGRIRIFPKAAISEISMVPHG